MREIMVEEGAAFMKLEGGALGERAPRGSRKTDAPKKRQTPRQPERFDAIVIGGGQAGLSVGYHLAQSGLSFVILDAETRTGDTWRRRWDSLRLFTPAVFDGLDGLPFPAPPWTFPTKDEMADYLESYAKHFGLPVRNGFRVDRLTREGERYVVEAGSRRLEAAHVVVAMASYQRPRVPSFAGHLDPGIVQLSSVEYRNPSQLKEGDVLIAGAGNSGAEIAIEVARSHRTWMSGRHPGHIPFRINGLAAKLGLARLVLRFLFHRVLTLSTPLGRRARPSVISKGGPLIRVKPDALAAAGVRRVPRIADVTDGKPLLEDGRTLEVANVIWCTGFHPGFSWIDLPVLDETGEPFQERGVVTGEPGLYFVGLHFLYAFSSTMIHGVGRDAEYVVRAIEARSRAARTQESTPGILAARLESVAVSTALSTQSREAAADEPAFGTSRRSTCR